LENGVGPVVGRGHGLDVCDCVLAGETVSRLIPPALLKRMAGAGFVVMGAWVLWSSGK